MAARKRGDAAEDGLENGRENTREESVVNVTAELCRAQICRMGYPEMVGPNRVGPELSAETEQGEEAGGLASPQRCGYWRLMRVGDLSGGAP